MFFDLYEKKTECETPFSTLISLYYAKYIGNRPKYNIPVIFLETRFKTSHQFQFQSIMRKKQGGFRSSFQVLRTHQSDWKF